jgi:hypothetical protein
MPPPAVQSPHVAPPMYRASAPVYAYPAHMQPAAPAAWSPAAPAAPTPTPTSTPGSYAEAMGFGPTPGAPQGWSGTAAPTVEHVAPQATSAAPTAKAPRPKKKHRIVGVALVTIVSLMIVGEGWRRMDQAARSSEEASPTTSSAAGKQAQPKRPPPPVDFTTPTTSIALTPGLPAFGHYRPDQIARRLDRLKGNVRITMIVDRGPVESPIGHLVAEIRFSSDQLYSMHAESSINGEDTTSDIVVSGRSRYIRKSTIPSLGDRWLQDPSEISTDLNEKLFLLFLREWDQPGSTYDGIENIDGFALDRFTIEPSEHVKAGDVTVDSSGTPFAMNIVIERMVPVGDQVQAVIDRTNIRVHYEEPVAIDVPTNVVSEADLKAGR